MVLGHWALAMSQELPAWPCPVPSTLGTSITMSSSSRGRQCPERRGHQPKGRTTRKWPRGGLECRVLRTVSRALSAQRGFGCLAETRKTHWVEGSSGSLWPAKNWYPQTVRNPQAALLPPPPYLGICVCQLLSHVVLFMTPWTVACQSLLSMEFSKQEFWSGLPFPSPGDLSNPGIEPGSPTLQVVVLSGAQYTFLNKLLSLKRAN